MSLYYSASTPGFFDDKIHDKLPKDAVPITLEEYRALLKAQSEGKEIKADSKGKPIAVDRPKPTQEQILERVRKKRDRLLAASDWTQMPDVSLPTKTKEAWTSYRQELRDITETFKDDLENIVWPEEPKK